jgi:DNA-binding response OmpR family regulator/HPt (histidine-containing phosphotransfer) domain-containing protein
MSAPTPDPAAALAALRERYRAGSGRIVEAFRTLAQRLAESPTAPEVLDALRRELHRVRGTAGSYGFSGVSELARQFEPQAKQWSEQPESAPERRAALVSHLADAIAAQFADDPDAAALAVGRRMVLVGVSESVAEALREHGPARGYRVYDQSPADWADDVHRASTHVLVAGAAALPLVQHAATAVHVPVVAVMPGSSTERLSRRQTPQDGLLVVDDAAGHEDIFAFADHIALRAAPAGATLLVLDDDAAILALVRSIVEPEGIRVVTLDEPSQLVPTLERVRPTVLLCDVHMDEYDGTALVRGLRTDPQWADLPILLFSSEADAANRADAYAAMADDFIAKPVVPAELSRRLRARIETVRLRRLAEGRHPGTGMLLPGRTLTDAEDLVAQAERHGEVALAVLRPSAAGDARVARAWLAEAARVAQALGTNGTVAGFADDEGVLVVRAGPGRELADALRALAMGADPDAPAWRAGVAAGGAGATVAALRLAAEAAIAAGRTGDDVVHLHEPRDDAQAPDVVVVEDDAALSDMLQYALRAAGFTYRAFDSGTEALEGMLRFERTPHRVLVLLDVDLPGLDGHTLHERLRLERPGQFAVVFCSVHAGEAEQLRAIEAGAIDWLTKPFSLRVLLAKVRRWRELALTG